MDAIEFLKEKDRMCKCYQKKNCEGCPFEESEQGIHHVLCAFKVDMWCDEDYVRTVEEWSKGHQVMTNAMKFKEVFGHCAESVDALNETWWNSPYKEP